MTILIIVNRIREQRMKKRVKIDFQLSIVNGLLTCQNPVMEKFYVQRRVVYKTEKYGMWIVIALEISL